MQKVIDLAEYSDQIAKAERAELDRRANSLRQSLGISARAANSLAHYGIETKDQLVAWLSEHNGAIYRTPNLGRMTINEIFNAAGIKQLPTQVWRQRSIRAACEKYRAGSVSAENALDEIEAILAT